MTKTPRDNDYDLEERTYQFARRVRAFVNGCRERFAMRKTSDRVGKFLTFEFRILNSSDFDIRISNLSRRYFLVALCRVRVRAETT